MEYRTVERWVEHYLHAWRSNDPADIGALFTPDARYWTVPFGQPWHGRDAIIAGWIARKDEPGSWRFTFTILARDGARAFVRGRTAYPDRAEVFHNLWDIQLDGEGTCGEFVEWWMQE